MGPQFPSLSPLVKLFMFFFPYCTFFSGNLFCTLDDFYLTTLAAQTLV